MTTSQSIRLLILLIIPLSSFGQSDTTKGKYGYEICVYIKPRLKPTLLNNKKMDAVSKEISAVRGKIYDFENGPNPYATVILINRRDGSKINTATDSLGNYNIDLPSGLYDFKVVSIGARQFNLKRIQIGSGQLRQIDVKLGDGSAFHTYSIISQKPINKRKLKRIEKRLKQRV